MVAVTILTNKIEQPLVSHLSCSSYTPSVLSYRSKTANIIKQNWNQFLLVVKAAALKQQISKFYPQILSTEASFYIYDRPALTDRQC